MLRLTSTPTHQRQTSWVYLKRHSIHAVKPLNEVWDRLYGSGFGTVNAFASEHFFSPVSVTA